MFFYFLYIYLTDWPLLQTGGDGCICYMEYDGYKQKMEFIGMKQVKELSLVRSLFPNDNEGHNNYAIGFTSADYLIWNLSTETKVLSCFPLPLSVVYHSILICFVHFLMLVWSCFLVATGS